jgi:prepilin-type N-terminal cleavage/methylation domain-containing protein
MDHLRLKQAGFSLIELLVVISVIGILAGLILVNLVGVRGRAGDARAKSDLKSLKTALRLYYNDYQQYPAGSNGAMMGCGATGTSSCSAGGEFSAGAGGSVYMGELPQNFAYYSDNADEFLLVVTLENASDTDIADSQAKCDPESRSYFTTALDTNDYIVCEL